ncbi:MAG: aminotransferase class I/II-fold pyridoxal phosphate-dependent enzyme [Cytophagaceae bacterium]
MRKLKEKLEQRKNEGNLRSLRITEGLVDFCSNDYLGLSRNKELSEAIEKSCRQLNTPCNGSTGSRLLSGNSRLALEIEEYLAKIFKAEKALVFNSGYNANLSILSCVPQKGDTILLDELIHASLKEGARLSFANKFSFRHNDLSDLSRKLDKASGDKFVVVESVYSMDGDFARLQDILELCSKYNAYLIVDEAHSTGLWGNNGNGLLCEMGLEKQVFARIYTFGKGMGVHGACIAGSEVLIDYLINFARPFIYTTSLPPHSLIAIREAFTYLGKHPEAGRQIHEKVLHFREYMNKRAPGLLRHSDSPIQVIDVSGNKEAKGLSMAVQNKGFDVRPILSPTVREGEERLRVCLHVYNTMEEIEALCNAILEHVKF